MIKRPVNTFKKKEKLKRKKEFQNIFQFGIKLRDSYFIIYRHNNSFHFSRIAIVTSRKFGNAVNRNRMKRRIREIYRTNKMEFSEGNDYIIIPTRKAKKISYKILKDKLFLLLNSPKKA